MSEKVTEFQYMWGPYPSDEGLSERGYEQVLEIVRAIQTKGNVNNVPIEWPAKVLVAWATFDMASAGLPAQVGIDLRFIDDTGEERPRRLIARLQFRFPKAGIDGLDQWLYLKDLQAPKH